MLGFLHKRGQKNAHKVLYPLSLNCLETKKGQELCEYDEFYHGFVRIKRCEGHKDGGTGGLSLASCGDA
jgi:hypothetical protein